MDFKEAIGLILALTTPIIKKLIQSTVVPFVKRRAYEKVDEKVDKLIEDLAQNATKIKDAKTELAREGFTEGTKLGIDTLRKIAEKLNKAADEIEKAITCG